MKNFIQQAKHFFAHKVPRKLYIVLALVLTLSTIVTSVLLNFEDTLAAVVPGNLVHVDPGFVPGTGSIVTDGNNYTAEGIRWDSTVDHPGYDRAYTEALSAAQNGTATTKHVVVKGSSIKFFGYDEQPYRDSVSASIKTFELLKFTLIPLHMRFHTFKRAGVIFGGHTIELVSLKQPMASDELSGIAQLRIDGLVVMDNIPNSSTASYAFEIVGNANGGFTIYLNGEARRTVSNIGDRLEFFTEYYQHDCPVVSYVQFELVTINKPGFYYPPTSVPENVTLYFRELGSNTEIATAHSQSGWRGQRYWIDPAPATIEDYFYVSTSGSTDSIIQAGGSSATYYYA
ncbi:MAG: hypothetical protein LBJ12_03755, partial [Oscillospiraceae bacterium]|nr:hypothetical protein [Oscillospiraceae bacterium]